MRGVELDLPSRNQYTGRCPKSNSCVVASQRRLRDKKIRGRRFHVRVWWILAPCMSYNDIFLWLKEDLIWSTAYGKMK